MSVRDHNGVELGKVVPSEALRLIEADPSGYRGVGHGLAVRFIRETRRQSYSRMDATVKRVGQSAGREPVRSVPTREMY